MRRRVVEMEMERGTEWDRVGEGKRHLLPAGSLPDGYNDQGWARTKPRTPWSHTWVEGAQALGRLPRLSQEHQQGTGSELEWVLVWHIAITGSSPAQCTMPPPQRTFRLKLPIAITHTKLFSFPSHCHLFPHSISLPEITWITNLSSPSNQDCEVH